MAPLDFSADEFGARARALLRPTPPEPGDLIARPRGDHDLQAEPVDLPDEDAAVPAAVLVPIVARAGGPTLLLTQRAAGLRSHSAQIAFPGGRADAEDAGPVETALREAREEIGLDPGAVTPLGFLDAYLTGTGYRVVPVVALVTPPIELTLNPSEVDRVFEAPLAFLMDPANHQRHGREFRGRFRTYYAMPYGDHYIWGATAGMIRNLYERLAG